MKLVYLIATELQWSATNQPSGFFPAFASEFDWVVDIYLKARHHPGRVETHHTPPQWRKGPR